MYSGTSAGTNGNVKIGPESAEFPDIEFVLTANEKLARRVIRVPRNGSPLLKAVANQLVRSRNLELQQHVLEEARRLQQFLVAQRQRHQRQVFAFSSAGVNEGVSSIVLNLAKAFELAGEHRILVIDANFRTPGLTRFLGNMGVGCGVIELLRGEARLRGALQKLAGAEVYFLGHGRKRRDQESLFTEPRVAGLLQRFAPMFDFILLDTPPFQRDAKSLVWGKLADGLILVMQASKTTLETVKKIKEESNRAGIELLGTVLNKRQNAIPRFIYDWH